MSEAKNSLNSQNSSKNLDLLVALGSEFTLRRQNNPRYSLRAFANSLDISHSILSLLFTKKRKFSRKTALKIIRNLNLDPQAFDLSQFNSRAHSKNFDDEYAMISLETFKEISTWVHYAILSLLHIKVDKNLDVSNPSWIAKRLGISKVQAQQSFKRLEDIGLIKKNISDRWVQTGKSIKVENTVTTEFTKQFHVGLLEKAIDTLLQNTDQPNDYSSMTMAIDPFQIPYAKKRIRQFKRELTAELEGKGKPKVVYNLTVQIYPVSID